MLEGKIEHVLGGVITALVVVGVFAIVASLVRAIAHKRIGTRGYYTAAVVVGFVLHTAVVSIISSNEVPGSSDAVSTQSNLDKRFVAPPEERVEQFPGQLESAIAELSAAERKRVVNAIEFLTFSVGTHLAESDPAGFEKLGDKDIAAKSFVRLYRFARRQGESMTLRHYIELANEFKKLRPEVWEEFQKING